jgi:hypothetical protein
MESFFKFNNVLYEINILFVYLAKGFIILDQQFFKKIIIKNPP